MNGHVYEEILLDIYGTETAETMHFPSSGGTFSIRQAGYYVREGKLLLNAEQVRTMADLLPEGSPVTKQQLIAFYLRKVVNIARRYTSHGLALLDLIGEGISGLIQAMEQFEKEGSFRFSAYATQCIRHSIESAIMNRSNKLLGSFRAVAVP